jgi:hypothetical protein
MTSDTVFDECPFKPDTFVKRQEIVEESGAKNVSPGFRPCAHHRIAFTFLGLSEQTLCL